MTPTPSHLERARRWLESETYLEMYTEQKREGFARHLAELLAETSAEAQREMRERAAAVAESHRIRNATEDGVLVESGYMQDGIAAAIRSLQ